MSMDSADSNTSQFIKQHAESQYEQFTSSANMKMPPAQTNASPT